MNRFVKQYSSLNNSKIILKALQISYFVGLLFYIPTVVPKKSTRVRRVEIKLVKEAKHNKKSWWGSNLLWGSQEYCKLQDDI